MIMGVCHHVALIVLLVAPPAWGALSLSKPKKQCRATAVVEVVLAQYHEDISWTTEYAAPGVCFTVYSKGEEPPVGAVRLPNVGRESHTFLHHIVHNYDTLAPWTVFSQAVRPSWGFRGGVSSSGHLSDNVEFWDYLQPFPGRKDSYFVFSAASHFPSGVQTSRAGILFKTLRSRSKDSCPRDGADAWGPWWFEPSHPHVRGRKPSMLEFYHRYIALDEKNNADQPFTLAFPQGARFAASRARIQARPRSYYETLLQQLSRSIDPIEGYWMEAAWYDVFHPEALQSKAPACSLPVLPNGTSSMSGGDAHMALHRRLAARGQIPLILRGPNVCAVVGAEDGLVGGGYSLVGGFGCLGIDIAAREEEKE